MIGHPERVFIGRLSPSPLVVAVTPMFATNGSMISTGALITVVALVLLAFHHYVSPHIHWWFGMTWWTDAKWVRRMGYGVLFLFLALGLVQIIVGAIAWMLEASG
jgi:hypothetical protein